MVSACLVWPFHSVKYASKTLNWVCNALQFHVSHIQLFWNIHRRLHYTVSCNTGTKFSAQRNKGYIISNGISQTVLERLKVEVVAIFGLDYGQECSCLHDELNDADTATLFRNVFNAGRYIYNKEVSDLAGVQS